MKELGWSYPEGRRVGLDFEDDERVAAYDRDQGADEVSFKEKIA